LDETPNLATTELATSAPIAATTLAITSNARCLDGLVDRRAGALYPDFDGEEARGPRPRRKRRSPAGGSR
jgi:hypothetical protein